MEKINEIPEEFKDGVRIIMLTLRSKEGGKVNMPDRVAKKVISRSADEFDQKFSDLLKQRTGQQRIYSTVDARDMKKAIREFKYRQLDAEDFDIVSHNNFYVDIWNRWISCLQSTKARADQYFMVDVDDDKDEEDRIRNEIEEKNLDLVFEYPTKNGRHFILNPFNPALVSFDVVKNHMILLAYDDTPY